MGASTNVYSLCEDNNIRIVLTPKLKTELTKQINLLPGNYKEISDKLNISYITLWEYLNKKSSVSLSFFRTLFSVYKINLEPYFEYLESGSLKNKAKIIRSLDTNFAKIFGAIAADGHLRKRITTFKSNKKATHYELILREEYFDNCLAFCKWFKNVFDIEIKPIKRKNHYEIYLSNKPIFLQLKFFGVNIGKKSDIVRIPEIIKDSKLSIKKSFLTGLFMFDGGVDYKNCYVSLVSKSRNLIFDVVEILNDLNLTPDYYSETPDGLGRYRIIFRKNAKIKYFLSIFESKTEKWHRISEHFYGFCVDGHLNFNDFIKILDKMYPRKRRTSLTFSDFLILLRSMWLNKYDISSRLHIGKTAVNETLIKLYRWGFIEKNLNGYKTKTLLPNISRRL